MSPSKGRNSRGSALELSSYFVAEGGEFQAVPDALECSGSIVLPCRLFVRAEESLPIFPTRMQSWRLPVDPAGVSLLLSGPTRDEGGKPRPKRSRRRRKGPTLKSGAVLGKYRVERLLGSGSFASVYLVTHMLLEAPFALKILHSDVVREDPRFVKQLYAEAKFIAGLDHPNVVRIVDLHPSGDMPYLVLEFVRGGTLTAAIRKQGSLPWAKVIRIGEDIAAGLEAALKNRLLHRDVKPANILLSESGVAKVIDLGLAHHDTQADSKRAGRVSIVGTPTYMAPEQAVDSTSIDFRADLYALGASLYHALVGRPPFRAQNQKELQRRKLEDTPESPSGAVECPAALEKLLLATLNPDPTKRPKSYRVFQEALREIASSPYPAEE